MIWIKFYLKSMIIEAIRPVGTSFFYKDQKVSRIHHLIDMHKSLVKLKGCM